MPNRKFTKETLSRILFLVFVFIFLERITISSSKEALKVCKQNFFQEIWAKSSVTCNLPVQLRFIDVVLSTAWVCYTTKPFRHSNIQKNQNTKRKR